VRHLADDPRALLRALAAGNFLGRSLPCGRLFRVEPTFFRRLQAECEALIADHSTRPFTLAENRTTPYGDAVQLCLLNRSGRLDDTSDTHDHSTLGKRFHHGDRFPTLASFIAAFPQAYNMRINTMGTKSGLSPHKEATLHRARDGGYYLRARFHLPIATNPGAQMLIGRDVFHFAEGEVYFFHNGMVHSAANEGATPRRHLVWDMLLSGAAVALMFGAAPAPPFLARVRAADWAVAPIRRHPGSAFEIVDGFRAESLYRRLHLQRFGIAPHQFCRWYLRAVGLRPRRIGFAEA